MNHPDASIATHTTYGSVVDLAGCDLESAVAAVLTLIPLDTIVPEPMQRMTVVGDEGRLMPVHEHIQGVVDRAEGRAVGVGALKRFAFYAAARRAFAVVRTSDPGPYGCLLLRKGTV